MKIWPFLTFLTWPWNDFRIFFVQIKSNCKINRDYRVLRPKWTIKHVSNDSFWKFWVWWPFLTWPWPWPGAKYETISLVSILCLVLGSTYGKFWATNATFKVTTVCKLKTPDFDLWPNLDLTHDLNFKFSKGVWKCLVEIFRMLPRPSLYVHPFLR